MHALHAWVGRRATALQLLTLTPTFLCHAWKPFSLASASIAAPVGHDWQHARLPDV